MSMHPGQILRLSIPILFIAAIILLFPPMRSLFLETSAVIRSSIASISAELGIVPQEEGIALGIYRPEVPYSFEYLTRLEDKIEREFDVISIYTTWGDRELDRFPAALLAEISRHGAIPMVTWEPWTTEFESTIDRDSTGLRTDLADITEGEYDQYIRAWAREAVIYGESFFLRFAHEMNNPQYPWSTAAGNSPEEFVAAWRHVRDIFREEDVTNVSWVWSPWQDPPRELYPGDEYVDWIGLSLFNYGPYRDDEWRSFESLYQNMYRLASDFGKPIMIAELGCVSVGGSQGEWFREAFRKLPEQFPATRAVVLYDNPADRTSPGLVIDWTIGQNAQVISAFESLGTADTSRNEN